MEDEKIVANLQRENPWWQEEGLDLEEDEYYRSHFEELKNQIEEEEITGILGPRRTGKTTVIEQIADYLVNEKGVEGERVLFIQLDNPYLVRKLDEPLNDVFEVYQDLILGETFPNLEEQVYIFIDEIQHINNWGKRLKYWYDRDYDINIVVSGSSSAEITIGSESLLGRMLDRQVLPLKFSETLRMKEKCGSSENRLSLDIDYGKNKKINRRALKKTISEGDISTLYRGLIKNQQALAQSEPIIKKEFRSYIKRGGFPRLIQKEVTEGKNLDYASRKLGDYADKAIRKDTAQIFDKPPQKLMDTAQFVADNTGQKLVETNLANYVDVEPETVKNYLEHLKKAHIVHSTPFYSKSKAKRARKKEKAYIWDPGLRNALIGSIGENYSMPKHERGLIVESIIADEAKRLCHNAFSGLKERVYWWYNNQNTKDVDLVLDLDFPLPIEVKYRNKISYNHMEGIDAFLDNHKDSKFGILLTKDKLSQKEINNGDVLCLPIWQFLLFV